MEVNVNNLVQSVKAIILLYAKPERIYVYGSFVDDQAGRCNDIDIAYDDCKFKDHFLIVNDIEKINTLIKIDVHNIASAEKRFKERVKSTGKVIYSATKQLRAEDGLYNFSKALKKFGDIVEGEAELNEAGFGDLYLDLVVKRFEFTFEMSWKALKRYLSYLGIEAQSPRMVFKEAYSQEIILDEAIWLDMIEQRNLSSHIYDEFEIKGILTKKKEYKKAFTQLEIKIKKGIKE